MAQRLPRALVLAAALAGAPSGHVFAQQDVDLRALDTGSGAFPTSPITLPSTRGALGDTPTIGASPGSASGSTVGSVGDGTSDADDRTIPNYGKPRKIRGKLYRPDPKASPPLPPLVPYRGAPGPQRKLLNPRPLPSNTPDPVLPAPTVAVVQPLPLPRRPLVEADPYAPTGVNVGELRLLPFVETSAGYDTNPNQVVPGAAKPSAALRVDGGVDVTSDFSRHSLTASLRAGYDEFPSNSNASRPNLSGNVVGKIDATRDDQIDVEGRFTLATQTPGSVLLSVPNSAVITNRPLVVSEGATLGETHAFGRLSLGLRTTVDRTTYGDATQSDGTIYPYSQDNYNDYGLVARAAYELTPGLIPFAEAGVDLRRRDRPADISGFYRDSVGGFARAGSTLEIARMLTGTISAGYLQRHYSDPRLTDLRGPSLDASLVYAATPLTTVTLRAATVASETTLPGASGAISRQVSLEVGHTFFRNFTLTGIATYQPNEYQGVTVDEHLLSFTLKGAYALSREIQIIGTASHQELDSSLSYNNFKDNTFLLGVRLQR